jgi:hypothetical protein
LLAAAASFLWAVNAPTQPSSPSTLAFLSRNGSTTHNRGNQSLAWPVLTHGSWREVVVAGEKDDLQILCICLRYVLLYWINFNIKWSCRLYLNHKIKRAAAKHTPTTSYHSFNKSTKPTITKKGPLNKNEIDYDDAERLYSSW